MTTPRRFFSDGFNSLSHFFFGYATNHCPIIGPIFITYQIAYSNPGDSTLIDFHEYLAGLITGVFMTRDVQ